MVWLSLEIAENLGRRLLKSFQMGSIKRQPST
jgi:hypothetical protein